MGVNFCRKAAAKHSLGCQPSLPDSYRVIPLSGSANHNIILRQAQGDGTNSSHSDGENPTVNGSPRNLKIILREKWPEAVGSFTDRKELYFPTGISELDRLFPSGLGIPCGQLIEITGGLSSGKTSLLFRLLGMKNPIGPQDVTLQQIQGALRPFVKLRAGEAQGDKGERIAYVDFSNSFFPDANLSPRVDLSRLLVIRPGAKALRAPFPEVEEDSIDPTIDAGPPQDHLTSGLRTAELLLRDRHVDIVVFDLVDCRTPLPIGLLHRLRLKTVRAKGLVIFLTQTTAIIPSSMASLRLEVQRIDKIDPNRLRVTVTKSRLCAERVRLEVKL